MNKKIVVTVDGEAWTTVSPVSKYDAIHAVAGAILAGADKVVVERVDDE